jgi:hypothetical protein
LKGKLMQSKSALTAATGKSSSSEVDMYVNTVAVGTFFIILPTSGRIN